MERTDQIDFAGLDRRESGQDQREGDAQPEGGENEKKADHAARPLEAASKSAGKAAPVLMARSTNGETRQRGMRPLMRQLLTVEGVRSSACATLTVPPRSQMNASTGFLGVGCRFIRNSITEIVTHAQG